MFTTMGLDTTHGAWNGPYSYFNKFRENISRRVGHELRQFEGFGGSVPFDVLKEDDIRILLDHSDCDGEISAEDCGKLSTRLFELAKEFPYEPEQSDMPMKLLILKFANGCKLAHKRNEPIKFQ
jgi:hypothetical protein